MNLSKDEFKRLLIRYQDGLCTEQEHRYLETWYENYKDGETEELSHSKILQNKMEVWQRLEESTRPKTRVRNLSIVWKVAASAVFLLGLSITGWKIYRNSLWVDYKQTSLVRPAIQEGQLILANGDIVDLNRLKKGATLTKDGLVVSRQANGAISYHQEASQTSSELKYNTLITPKGQLYHLVLTDGTKVTLNAGSSIRFPNRFDGDRRRVFTQGEVFFDVVHNKEQPFVVETGQQQIEVLGTQFIVDDFEDNGLIKTSLLQGRVRLTSGHKIGALLLMPGQQGQCGPTGLTKTVFNPEIETAWLHNDFVFMENTVPTILKELERWYDIETNFEPSLANLKFSGAIARTKSLQEVLDIMSSTGRIKFEMRGKELFASMTAVK